MESSCRRSGSQVTQARTSFLHTADTSWDASFHSLCQLTRSPCYKSHAMLPRVSGTKTRRHLLWRRWWACARRSRMNKHCTCTSQKYTERLGALCELEFHRHRIGAIFTWTSKLQHRWQTLLQDCSPSWAWGRVHRQSHMSKVTISSTVTVMPLSTLDSNKKKIYNIFGANSQERNSANFKVLVYEP